MLLSQSQSKTLRNQENTNSMQQLFVKQLFALLNKQQLEFYFVFCVGKNLLTRS